MIGEFNLNKDGLIVDTISGYQPGEEIKDITAKVKSDYGTGYLINNRSFREFNDMSLLARMDADQKDLNIYIPAKSDDPDEAWRWPGKRGITRNKIISMAAHLTASIIYPGVFAQNEADEEDKEAAEIMRSLIEWNIRNSDYEMTFLYGVVAALANPVAWFHEEYVEAMQTIKDRAGNKQEVLDEVMSGLQIHNVPADEMYIANPYQFYLQRQRFLIRRRFLNYNDMKNKYGEHKHFKYVAPGTKVLYNSEDGTFYNQKDTELGDLCEEAIYYNRLEDIEMPFVNGIYHGDDSVGLNRIKHRDNTGNPKYAYVKTGYEPIDEKRFFFYKSGAAKLSSDSELHDRMWRMIMDGTYLEVMPPLATSGGEKVDSSVIFPGEVTNFPKDTTITPIKTGTLAAGVNALGLIEKSMDEGSEDVIRQGISPGPGRTLGEIQRLERNARIQLGMFGKMIMSAVKGIGHLMIDDIIRHQTIGEIEEVMAGEAAMKYRTFLLPDQIEGGRKVTKKIRFKGELMGKKLTAKERERESFRVLKEQGGPESDTKIYEVNPVLFGRLKFLITVDPETLMPRNEEFERAFNLEFYDRAMLNPFVDKEAVTRDCLIDSFKKGMSNKYMRKVGAELPIELPRKGAKPLTEQVMKKGVLAGMG